MKNLNELIYNIGIVPVVKLDRTEDALPLAKALIDGFIPCAEVTFRTDKAADSIRLISDTYPDMLVGAGTVLTKEQVNEAIAAGAKFIVSPGFNPEIVQYCIDKDIPIFPGTSSATDIEQALVKGLDVVKFFPAEINGGLKAINALSGPYPNLKFMPTGGVNLNNMTEYLDSPKVLACGGTWMVSETLINQGQFDEITRISQEAVLKMLGFEIGHVGINPNGNDLPNTLNQFANLFTAEPSEGATSYFVDNKIEIMKEQGLGQNGHIAIRTSNIVRAQNFLEKKGFSFDKSTEKVKDGKVIALYLTHEIAGFAIHLVQK